MRWEPRPINAESKAEAAVQRQLDRNKAVIASDTLSPPRRAGECFASKASGYFNTQILDTFYSAKDTKKTNSSTQQAQTYSESLDKQAHTKDLDLPAADPLKIPDTRYASTWSQKITLLNEFQIMSCKFRCYWCIRCLGSIGRGQRLIFVRFLAKMTFFVRTLPSPQTTGSITVVHLCSCDSFILLSPTQWHKKFKKYQGVARPLVLAHICKGSPQLKSERHLLLLVPFNCLLCLCCCSASKKWKRKLICWWLGSLKGSSCTHTTGFSLMKQASPA